MPPNENNSQASSEKLPAASPEPAETVQSTTVEAPRAASSQMDIPDQSAKVTIGRTGQLAFVIAVASVEVANFINAYTTYFRSYVVRHSYPVAFHLSEFIFPLLFVIVGYMFAKRNIQGTIPKVFWAVLLATIGLCAFQGFEQLEIWISILLPGTSPYGPLWLNPNVVLAEESVVFATYCYVVWRADRKGMRA